MGCRVWRIPKLEFFTQLTGIPANHISVTLNDLVLMGVVVVTGDVNGPIYEINPDSDRWQVKPRQSRTTIHEAMNMFRELNGLPRQTEREVNFNLQQVMFFLANRHTDSLEKSRIL